MKKGIINPIPEEILLEKGHVFISEEKTTWHINFKKLVPVAQIKKIVPQTKKIIQQIKKIVPQTKKVIQQIKKVIGQRKENIHKQYEKYFEYYEYEELLL